MFLQDAKSEREKTAVEVNRINLDMNKMLRTAKAEASLVRTMALIEAKLIKAHAEINGTRMLLALAGIKSHVDPLIPGHGQTMPRSVSFTRQHHLNVAREPSWLS